MTHSQPYLPLFLTCTLFACKGNEASTGATSAATAAEPSTSQARATATAAQPPTAPAQAAPPFTGKLTTSMLASYREPVALFSKPADEAIAMVSASLGMPTARDEVHVSWAAADDVSCRSFNLRINGKSVTSIDSAPEVKANAYGEQWGILCLLRAGREPIRRPFNGKTVSVSELLDMKSSDSPIRVRGVLREPRPAAESGASFLLADAAVPAKSRRCNLELGAMSPTAQDGKSVTVQCASTACNHCFFVK